MFVSPPEVEQGGNKDLTILKQSTGIGKHVHFRAEHCQKYRLYRKML